MKLIKVFLPVAILMASLIAAWALVAGKKTAPAKIAEAHIPRVVVVTAQPESLRLDVLSQGIVAPRTEIQLVAEVAGKIVKIHPALAAGGFFKAGELLIEIDPRDYDYAVTKAQAAVAEARKELAREQAEAEQAEKEWQALGGGSASDFVLRKPHLAERRAKLAAAEADLAQARLQRGRCVISAPFAGRVRSKQADVGQYAAAGALLADVYATDMAEIRLPIPSDQIEFVNLPMYYADFNARQNFPAVKLSARFAGQRYEWLGKIVRTEGKLDEKTGMLYAIAQVPGPYNYDARRPPLAVGLFVQAEIAGRERRNLVKIPRDALRSSYQVYIVDAQNRLRQRSVEILRNEGDFILVNQGLAAGDRVMVSGVELPVENMRVQVQDAQAAPPNESPGDQP